MEYTLSIKEKPKNGTALKFPAEVTISFFDDKLHLYWLIGIDDTGVLAIVYPKHARVYKELHQTLKNEAIKKYYEFTQQ